MSSRANFSRSYTSPRISLSRSSATALSIIQPTAYVDVTTTFNPPSACTENHLSMLRPPQYFIWANEPVPAPNITSSACYPKEFLQSYTSVSVDSVGSSVVPALNGLACPINYCTMLVTAHYVACCPSNYQFSPPRRTIDPHRPGYGGTCYSDFDVSSTYTMTAFDAKGSSSEVLWVASTSGAQAYAHPIDGFAQSFAAVGCPNEPTARNTSYTASVQLVPESSPLNPETSPISKENSSKSPPAKIAGIVLGALAVLTTVVVAVWLALQFYSRRRRRRHKDMCSDDILYRHEMAVPIIVHEKWAGDPAVLLALPADGDRWVNMGRPVRKSTLNGGKGAFEVMGDLVPELEATR